MKKQLIAILILLLLLTFPGCGNAKNSEASGDDKVLLQTIDHLSKINSYEIRTSRVESTAFGDKKVMSQIITEQKIIFAPFVIWSRTDSTSAQMLDGTKYRSLRETYQVLNDDQLDMYMRYSPDQNPATGKEPVLGEWQEISTAKKEQADWAVDNMRSNFAAQLYLLSSNIDTFEIVENDAIEDENILRYDGYLEQTTILKAYQKYIRNSYVKGGMLKDSKNLSLEDLKNEITGGDMLEIKTGIPKLAYSEKPISVSLWIDKSSLQLEKVTVDEMAVLQSYMEKEMPKVDPELKDPIVSKALLTYEIKSIDKLKEIPMPE